MWWRGALLILVWLPPVACAAEWVRSYFAQDLVDIYHHHSGAVPAFERRFIIRSDSGVLAFEIDHDDPAKNTFGGRPASQPAEPPTWNWYTHHGLQVMKNYGDA